MKYTKLLQSQKYVKANYYYFGIFFILLVLIHIVHVAVVDQGDLRTKFFFVVYALMQSFLEILGLVMIGGIISSYLPKFWTPIYTVSTLFLFLAHVVDFPLVRLMDISIWYALDFI